MKHKLGAVAIFLGLIVLVARGAAARQEAARGDRPGEPRFDYGLAVWPVRFGAGQRACAGGHSLCACWRSARPACRWSYFSISAAIGFVSLLGISVMDGILMLTYYNEVMQREHMPSIEGMFHAASQRMRPMLMTALSACIGLVSAAISTGIGSQVQRPLATVVVGGLLIGPLMLLVVVPPLRMVFLGWQESEGRRNNE